MHLPRLAPLALALLVGCGSSSSSPAQQVDQDSGTTCATGKTLCNGACVDLKTEFNHCGACGTECKQGEACSAGACSLWCAGGTTKCGELCADLKHDPANCGQCAVKCTADDVCSNGSCGAHCQQGETLCNGLCVDLKTDNASCGKCGASCASGKVCSAGACALTCQQGLVKCDGTCTDPTSSLVHCGASSDCAGTHSGIACASGEVCSNGACSLTCAAGMVICNNACIDPNTSTSYCGASGDCSASNAGVACASGELCSAGACAVSCQAGLTECNGTCVDTQVSNPHCGGCGQPCDPGTVCSAGTCAVSCQAGLTECNGTCVDTQVSNQHCGGCGQPCDPGTICAAGTCAVSCQAGLTECNGTCVDTQVSNQHCGGCGQTCPSGQVCAGASCVLQCPTGFSPCNSVCADFATDSLNCGACGTTCGISQTCVAQNCKVTFELTVPPVEVMADVDCEDGSSVLVPRVAVDDANTLYVLKACHWQALPFLYASVDGGNSYKPKLNPEFVHFAPVRDLAMAGGAANEIHVAKLSTTGEVEYAVMTSSHVWAPDEILPSGGALTDYGVRMAVNGNHVYLAVAVAGGVRVFHNDTGGIGPFQDVLIPQATPAFFGVMVHPTTGDVWVATGTPDLKTYRSTDGAKTFVQYNPQWKKPTGGFEVFAIGPTKLFVAGDSSDLQYTDFPPNNTPHSYSIDSLIPNGHRNIATDRLGHSYVVGTDWSGLVMLEGQLSRMVYAQSAPFRDLYPDVAAVQDGHTAFVAYFSEDLYRIYATVQRF